MPTKRRQHGWWSAFLRSALLVSTVGGTEVALVRWAEPLRLLRDLGRTTPTLEQLLVAACAMAASLAGGWLLLVTLVEVGRATALSLRTGVAPSTGPLVRRIVLSAFGVALTTGLASPVLAQPQAALFGVTAAAHRTPDAGSTADTGMPLAGLALPERTVGMLSPRAACWEVSPGESLWSIAERLLDAREQRPHLGGRPTAGDIAEAVRVLHRHNRARIGENADLILPGLRLAVPASLLDQSRR